jgi:predicted anti-sigma-YlaC factor YlaD
MTDDTCQIVQISAMALRDGQTGPLSAEQVQQHLHQCQTCREAVAQMESFLNIVDLHVRRPVEADLWPRIESALKRTSDRSTERAYRLALAGLLIVTLGCKLLSLHVGFEASVLLALASGATVGAALCWLRVNPFRIAVSLKA